MNNNQYIKTKVNNFLISLNKIKIRIFTQNTCQLMCNNQNSYDLFLEEVWGNVTVKALSNHFGELLRNFRRVRVSWGAFSQRHHHEDLEKLLLLQLDQVSLQGAVAWPTFQCRLDVNGSPGACWIPHSDTIL